MPGMNTTLIKTIRNLSPDERIKLIEDIWETIQSDDLPDLTPAQEKLLDQRLAAHREHPERSMSLSAFKKKIADAKTTFRLCH